MIVAHARMKKVLSLKKNDVLFSLCLVRLKQLQLIWVFEIESYVCHTARAGQSFPQAFVCLGACQLD